jgi:hypothetical protein
MVTTVKLLQARGPGNPKMKRAFSNRTKTGCLTCRRRKKKCDEGQPRCKSTHPHWLHIWSTQLKLFTGNNCVHGGFQCEGYKTRSTRSKLLNTKAQVPLQSKDGFPVVNTKFHPRRGGWPTVSRVARPGLAQPNLPSLFIRSRSTKTAPSRTASCTSTATTMAILPICRLSKYRSYGVEYRTAAVCDTFFYQRWKRENKDDTRSSLQAR